jgi:hypothetical protein
MYIAVADAVNTVEMGWNGLKNEAHVYRAFPMRR